MKQSIFIIIALLFSNLLLSQEETDREGDELVGPVKSVRHYSIDSDGHEVFYQSVYYNPQGMKVKLVYLSSGIDSIEYRHDEKNRLVMKIDHVWETNSHNNDKYTSVMLSLD